MASSNMVDIMFGEGSIFKAGLDYMVDSAERSTLFLDVLRQRGNNYLEHIENGQPPVLVFDYDIIIDGRNLKKPANYSLAQILDKRRQAKEPASGKEKRKLANAPITGIRPDKRPIVIIDPRAGHGPGIGGSKQDSEIGLALANGHPVYFILFYTDPMPGQKLVDVKNAEIIFLEEVKKRHPDAPRPTVIGNCQGGWAGALVGADRPDLVGPLLLNGSPLSYWSGVEGVNPMRYKGGLCGGVWLNSLLGDLGNGKFDGANLVYGMELLNPANTLWSKQYNLYSKVDTEAERFLDFERWWGGFYLMNTEEIHQIVNDLFIGNKLVRGTLELEEGKQIDLKRFNDPVVVFASKGDNITPPQQALNWIHLVYESVDEIKRHNQIIVYIIHPKIGHLGIFVSTSIAKKEQQEIIGSVEMIEYLSPGLYEMVIEKEPSEDWMNDYKVKFVEREMEDIMAFDDGLEDEDAFKHVAVISELNDKFYKAFLSPVVQSISNDASAELLKQMHPLRSQRYLFSDLNPFLKPVEVIAEQIKKDRHPIEGDNIFSLIEKSMSDMIVDSLNLYRDISDQRQEDKFNKIYKNPAMKIFFPDAGDMLDTPASKGKKTKARNIVVKADEKKWRDLIETGGYPEGAIRLMVAMASVDGSVDEAEIKLAGKIVKEQRRLKNLSQEQLRTIVREQARILQTDRDKALKALAKLITTKKDRDRAMKLAQDIAFADSVMDIKEKQLLNKLEKIFYGKK